VLLYGAPVAVVGSSTIHAGCCGANKGVVIEGYTGLLRRVQSMTPARMASIAFKLRRL
jgi:hypothetical protein